MTAELSRLVPGAWCCGDRVEALLEAVPGPTMGWLCVAALLLWAGLGSGDAGERKPWRSVSHILQQSEGLEIVPSHFRDFFPADFGRILFSWILTFFSSVLVFTLDAIR